MSRVGKAPVFLDKTVNVTVSPKKEVVVKGAKNPLPTPMLREIKAKAE